MKQMMFMAVMTFLGMAGAFVISPVWGVAVYYLFAVLRPAGIWEHAEAMGMLISDVSWSYYVAIATMVATILWRIGLLLPIAALKPPWYGNPKYTRSHYLFLAFTCWISLTYFTAVNQERAEPWAIEYVKIFVMFVCSTLVLRTIRDLWVIFYVVLGCAVYAAYEINFYYFVDGVNYLYSRGYGGLDNNGAALIVAMAVPMAYFAWEATPNSVRLPFVLLPVRWCFLLVIPLLIHALMLSFSRGGMLALLAAAIPIWLRSRHKWFLTASYVFAALFFLAAAGDQLWDRLLSIGEYKSDESAQSRFKTWEIAWEMAKDRPLFGFGIRCSNLYTKSYGADMEGRSIHSQYLQTLADSGFPALLFYLGLLVSLFLGLWNVRRFLRKYPGPETMKVKSLTDALESALVVFCVGAFFLSLEHFEMPYVLILLAVQLNAITQMVAKQYANAPPPSAPPEQARQAHAVVAR